MSNHSHKDLFSPELYYKAIEGSDSGLWVLDVASGKCYLSPRYYTMLGYDPDAFEGTMENLFALLHPDDVDRTKDVMAELFSGEASGYRNEVRLKRKSGSYQPILTQGQAERNEAGEITRLIGWNIDITLLKETQRKLDEEHAINVASARLAQIGVLSGGLSHEVNNPLTVIQWRTERALKALQRDDLVDRGLIIRDLAGIQEAVKRIVGIVSGLRTIASGGMDRASEDVPCNQVVAQVLALCQTQLEVKNIRLHVDLAEEPPVVRGNLGLLCQVLLNLVNNAADALETSPEKDLWITVRPQGKWASLTVEDSGPGIRPSDLEKLMLPFFTTKEPGKGMGLGLSISKSIVESMHGKLEFVPETGRTTFRVRLPLQKPLDTKKK